MRRKLKQWIENWWNSVKEIYDFYINFILYVSEKATNKCDNKFVASGLFHNLLIIDIGQRDFCIYIYIYIKRERGKYRDICVCMWKNE